MGGRSGRGIRRKLRWWQISISGRRSRWYFSRGPGRQRIVLAKKLEGGMGRPTHPWRKAKAGKREDVMKERAAAMVKRGEERQGIEMKKITLGACLGRTEYAEAWREIGGLEIMRRGVILK
jgi:hypothetical protein